MLKLDFPHGWGGELTRDSYETGRVEIWLAVFRRLQVVLSYLLYSLHTTQSDNGMRKNLS